MMNCCCSQPPIRLQFQNPSGHRMGSHTHISESIYETIRKTNNICSQIFLGSPQSYHSRQISPTDKELTKNYCQQEDKTFYVHCPYIANLAKPSPLDITPSVKVVNDNLEQIADLPAACVLHIGKVGTIENVAQRLNQIQSLGYLSRSIHNRISHKLLLEVAAGQGTELGTNLEEIRHLFEGLDKSTIGICLDTQHAYASGLCRFQKHEDVITLFDDLYDIVPYGVSLVHLNDSVGKYKCRVDRHAALTKGYIWYENQEGLKTLVSLCQEKGIDMISETNDPLADKKIIDHLIAN